MKIVRKDSVTTVYGYIQPGEVFRIVGKNEVYMKTKDSFNSMSVCFDDNKMYSISNDVRVVRLDARIEVRNAEGDGE